MRAEEPDHVTFPTLPSASEPEKTSESDAFAFELFGELNKSPPAASWTPVMLSTVKSEARLGLKDELRNNLLTTYEPKDDLLFLTPPKVNKEILPNLAAAALARDKHQLQSQLQLGAALNAIGAGMTGLIGLEFFQSSVEGKAAVSKISDGVHLLADLHYRLSQARRAFIVPSLNFLGKTASDAAPIDDCLFGNNFAEDVNAAQTVEKVARKMSKKPPPSNQQARQPVAQRFKQQRNQPLREIQQNQENSRAPLRKTRMHQSKRGPYQSHHNRRLTSRSRTRAHR